MKTLYRAESFHTGLETIGNLFSNNKGKFIIEEDTYNKNITEGESIKVFDKVLDRTLSFHISGMEDSEGNMLFGQLEDSDKGGDYISCEIGAESLKQQGWLLDKTKLYFGVEGAYIIFKETIYMGNGIDFVSSNKVPFHSLSLVKLVKEK